MSKPHSNHSELEKFTRQEKKIMCLILEGCSNREIASKLDISRLTIKTHKQNIARKAEVKGSSSLRKFVISIAETLKILL